MIPSKKQYDGWTTPSKASYKGYIFGIIFGIIGIVGVGLTIYSLIPPKIKEFVCTKDSPKENCPLEIDVYGYKEPHPDGAEIDGIVWKDNYVDVRMSMVNRGFSKIENISFVFNPETHITKAVQATNVSDVNVSPNKGPIKEIALGIKTEDGVERVITPDTSAPYIAPAVNVQCPELLQNGEIKIVTACIALNPWLNGKPPHTLVAPRRPPKWVNVFGMYEIIDAGRQKRYHFKHQFKLKLESESLKEIPKKLDTPKTGTDTKPVSPQVTPTPTPKKVIKEKT